MPDHSNLDSALAAIRLIRYALDTDDVISVSWSRTGHVDLHIADNDRLLVIAARLGLNDRKLGGSVHEPTLRCVGMYADIPVSAWGPAAITVGQR